MSAFPSAVDYVIQNEGSLTNDPDDPGGLTNWGLTLPVMRDIGAPLADVDQDGDIDLADIRALTREQAMVEYRAWWWDRFGYDRIFNQAIATKVMDCAVNFGPSQGHKVAQRAVRAACGIALADDGIFGCLTIAGLNASDPARLLVALASEAAGVYRMIAARRPELTKFLPGWLNRAYRLPSGS